MLGMVYFAPENSTYNTEDYFTVLHEELASLPDDVDILIGGDFNTRTSYCPDYSEADTQNGSDGGLSQLVPNDTHSLQSVYFTNIWGTPVLYTGYKIR